MGEAYGKFGSNQGGINATAGAGIFGTIASVFNNLYNNQKAEERAKKDRAENYKYSELAASNADDRTRALYNDFYSPKALLKHYQEAGLSPSLMFDGTPGQGGMSGAQGSGASGIQTPYYPMTTLEGAQTAAIIAGIQKTKAETANINKDTDLKKIEEAVAEMSKIAYKYEFEMLEKHFNVDGKEITLQEAAGQAVDEKEFIEWYRIHSESRDINQYQLRTLRSIYRSEKQFSHDIAVLSSEEVNSKFTIQIVDAMQDKDFAKLNAEAAVAYLRANIQTADLTEQQKKAWNNLIEKLGEHGETFRDVTIVLASIINNAMMTYKLPAINNNNYTTNNTTNNIE